MNWLSILLQANLYLVLFYGFYHLLLQNETFYNFNRIYLVGTTLLAFLIPLLQSDWVQSWFITEQVQTTYAVVLQPAMVVWKKPIQPQFTLNDAFRLVYFAGLLYFAIRLIINILRIKKILRQAPKKLKEIGAFSFFKKIFIDEELSNKETVLMHEKVHVQQLHSADVLLLEILSVVCWFNPIVYFYKQAIKHIHEFIADEIAAKNEPSKAAYAMLLFSQQFGVKPLELSNSFYNKSLLKQRIIMLNKPRSRKTALLKYGLSVPLFITMLVISSATVAENTFQQPKPKNKVDVSIKLNPNYLTKESTVQGEIFETVEHNPEFPRGIQNMYGWLGKHIKYPKDAIKNKIGGKVFVRFVVKKDGYIGDVEILKGIGYGCDDEAIRVVKLMPRWKAGKQNGKPVNVYFTMPIVFQLDDDNKIGDVPTKSKGADKYMNYKLDKSQVQLENAKIDSKISQKKPNQESNTYVIKNTEKQEIGWGFANQNTSEINATPNSEIKVIQPKPKETNDVLGLRKKYAPYEDKTTKVIMTSKGVEFHPIYVVNGKITADIASLQPESIESMDFLKDEAAIKIYGESGKNGVVIIKTK